jgi:membrane protease YdiL (CAAX protease family)
MSSLPPASSWPPAVGHAQGGTAGAPEPREALPPWPPWSAAIVLFASFAIAVVGGLVVTLVGHAFGGSLEHPPPAVNIAATVVQDVSFVTAALLLAHRFGPLVPAQFGLRRTPLRPAIRWVLGSWLAFFALSGVWAALVNTHERDQLPKDLGVETSTVALVAVCVLVTVIAPLAEEFLFRGYMFTALRRWRGPWVAAALTGLVFGAIHVASAPVVFLAPLALLGFLLCVVRWKTRSLLPCFAIHALNNSIAFAVGEAHWNAWQTLLLIAGAVGAVLLATLPFLGPRGRPRDAWA